MCFESCKHGSEGGRWKRTRSRLTVTADANGQINETRHNPSTSPAAYPTSRSPTSGRGPGSPGGASGQRSCSIPARGGWRRIRPHLIELASLPNVFAWWSEDRDTGPAAMPVGRPCFLCVEAADEALVPPGVLVFREEVKTARKWLNGSWVCPKEQGTGAGRDLLGVPALPAAQPDAGVARGRKRGRSGSASQPRNSEAASACAASRG